MSRSTNPKWQTRTKDCERYKRLLESKELPRFPATVFAAEDFSAQQAVLSHSFAYPTVVHGLSDAFGLRVPDWDVSLAEVANRLGEDGPIRLMDVAEQREIGGFTIAQYAQYIEENRSRQAQGEAGLKILNLISLEFSDTPLSENVCSPAFVRDLDWERLAETQLSLTHAHTQVEEQSSSSPSSKVQKYCLIGMAGSYTDFHVDFGGTSVWYHVVRGAKRFYLIPPTETNLQRYQEWNRSQKQQSTFLGDLVGKRECFSLDLHAGETLLLPSAWIHAVYTPEDSLVFGGNFLHSLAIRRQLQCFAIEAELKIARIFRYPRFEQLHWKILCLAFHSFSLGEGEKESVIVNNERNRELSSAWKMFEFLLTQRAVLSQLREVIDHCIAWQLQPVSLQSSRTEAEQTQAMQEEIKSFCEQSTGYAPQEVAQKLAQAVSERLRKKSEENEDDDEEEDVPEVDDTYWKCILSSSAQSEPITSEKKDDDKTDKSDKEEEEEIPEEGEEERKYRLHMEQSMRKKQKRTKAKAKDDDDDDYRLEFVHVQSTRSGRTSKRVRKDLLEDLVDDDELEEEEAEDEDLRDDNFDEDDYEDEDEDHVEDEYVPEKRSTKRASASNSRSSARSSAPKKSSAPSPKKPASAPAAKASPAPAAPAAAPKRAQQSKRDKLKALLGKKK